MPPRSLFLLLGVFVTFLVAQPPGQGQPQGVLPRGVDGKPLNLDFETGDLRDWAAEGEAFKGQPIKGDTVVRRRADSRSEHAGQYWIGGFELHGDRPQGTLTSAPFKVTHRWAAFLVGGGPHQSTCVELVEKESGKVFHRAPGHEAENMRREVVDLQAQMGKEIFLRLVDRHAGHWGHVNFDDFKFYESKPSFPGGPKRLVDLFPHAGLSPDKAAEVMTVPEGFKVTAFAGEPDVRQPIAMTIDHRGRLWVVECYSYPGKVRPQDAKDRILIFEDADGDGKFDKRTVFLEGLNLATGIEVGFGGVFIGQAPELLFIPDRDGDDKPDGKPEVLLNGWGLEDTHETLNSFIWGPDGWLYGCHGVFTHSRVGPPDLPKDSPKRVRINAGIWRYHPLTRQFEVFAEGTSNPWGVDFNDHGDAFLTCCVIPHLFHVIPGARYHRQAGQHFNPNTYDDIKTIANHRHWVGNQWNDLDRARSDQSGGGHAHAGAMVYLGDTWPAKYRGQLFMNNIHGARLNVDRLTPRGSGYVGDGEPDFLKANDLWSQILYLRHGPDGNVFMIDWYDRNQCHHGNAAGHDCSNGRLFKISYHANGERKASEKVDLSRKTDLELADLQLHRNDWYVRTARRLLMERAATRKIDPKARQTLAKLAFDHADSTRRLRGLWALHVTGGLSEEDLEEGLSHKCSHVQRWTVRLACESGKPGRKVEDSLHSLAGLNVISPAVRLEVAAALQRLPLEKRWTIAEALLSHAADADDHNLPLMYWYAIEPLVGQDAKKALRLTAACRIPRVQSHIVRRLGAGGEGQILELLVAEVAGARDSGTQKLFLEGIRQALVGKREVPAPKGWGELYKKLWHSENRDVSLLAKKLAVTFGDADTRALFRTVAGNSRLSPEERRDALATLLAVRDRELLAVLHELLREEPLRGDALRGLAVYEDPKAAEAILTIYPSLTPAEKRDALSTLTSRVSHAKALLGAIAQKKVKSTDLTADLVRQMRNLKDAEIDKQIATVWGVVRESPEEKARQIAHYRKVITGTNVPAEDLPKGRAVFVKVCAQCHTLFDTGGKVGPELTGSNRRDLDYILSNILDPSAVMAKEYIPNLITTSSGRVITGLIKEQTRNALTLVTANETVVLPRDEIESIQPGEKSMMPEDLLRPLSDDEVRQLVAYLASPRQIPQPATKENAKDFFNGKDLRNWTGNPKLWKASGGEIVGNSPGLKKNEFLISDLEVEDFKLSLEVKLTPNKENSGIQFRSQELPGGDVKGYQADIGEGWWGKLYEEHGRHLLTKEAHDQHVKPDLWNHYEIHAEGSRIRIKLNGQLCVDLDDPKGARRGILALQIHSGGPLEVRFRNIKLEVLK